MNKETEKSRIFLVLVPHRDVRNELQKNSKTIEHVSGIYNFPHVTPLALLSGSLTDNELKNTAHLMREITKNEKIYTGDTSCILFPAENLYLYGYQLNINISADILKCEKIKEVFSPPVIGAYLFPHSHTVSQKYPALGFRAAALANMYWKPFYTETGETGFKWKIGKLTWLPKIKK